MSNPSLPGPINLRSFSNEKSLRFDSQKRVNVDEVKESSLPVKSIACLISSNQLVLDEGKGVFSRQVLPLAKWVKAHHQGKYTSESFKNEPVAGLGTAFLVGPDHILTSAHSVCKEGSDELDEEKIRKSYVVFDFKGSSPVEEYQFSHENQIYTMQRVVDYVKEKNSADWALIQLDRAVEDRPPIPLSWSSEISDATPTYLLGHPHGLPMKYAEGFSREADPTTGQKKESGESLEWQKELLGRHGGSPIFHKETHQAIGMVVGGGEGEIGLPDAAATLSATVHPFLGATRLHQRMVHLGNPSSDERSRAAYALGSSILAKQERTPEKRLDSDQLARAAKLFEETFKEEGTPQALYNQAYSLYHLGEKKEAHALFTQLIAIESIPENVRKGAEDYLQQLQRDRVNGRQLVEQLYHLYHQRGELNPLDRPQQEEELLTTLGSLGELALAGEQLTEFKIKDIAGEDYLTLKNLLDSGLLEVSSGETNSPYRFSDRALQEYLVAYAISKRSKEEQRNFALAHRTEPPYQGVLTLLAGLLYQADKIENTDRIPTLFSNLCEGVGHLPAEEQKRSLELIFRCLNECTGHQGDLSTLKRLWPLPDSLLKIKLTDPITGSALPLGAWLSSEGWIESLNYLVRWVGTDFLHETSSNGKGAAYRAILGGHLEVVQWLQQQDPALLQEINRFGYTLMYSAAELGYLEIVQWLHQQDPSLLPEVLKEGYPIMCRAAERGHLNVMQWMYQQDNTLLQKGLEEDRSTPTPMHLAAQEGHLKVMQWMHQQDNTLLQKTRSDGYTPMHSAAVNGHVAALEWMHQQDSTLLQRTTNDNKTPLYMAAYNGHVAAMQWIHQQDRTLLQQATTIGHTPMHIAAQRGHIEAMQWIHQQDRTLLQKARSDGWAPIHAAAYGGHVRALEWIHQQDSTLLQQATDGGRTPMHIAAYSGHIRAMQWIHQQDSTLLQQATGGGWTPMHTAVQVGRIQVMQWIHQQDSTLLQQVTDDGWTPMHIAAEAGSIGAMQWIHQQDSSLLQKAGDKGFTPIHTATFNGHLQALEWIHQQDKTLLQKATNEGHTPMHLAAQQGQIKAMQWIHQQDKTLLQKATSQGVTPMHSAAIKGHVTALEWIHQQDKTLLQRATNDESTPMHSAAVNGHVIALEWMHQQDKTLLQQTIHAGHTLMHIAVEVGQIKVMEWIYQQDKTLLQKATDDGLTLMHSAAANGHVAAMEWIHQQEKTLLQRAANDGLTPMHLAAATGHVAAMEWIHQQDKTLLQRAANDGLTPMGFATGLGQIEVAQWIQRQERTLLQEKAR